MTRFVIVGGGLAAAKAAETLREEGFDGEVVLFAGEPELPYERPPLSKGYLLGQEERDSAFVHPADWYAKHDIDLRTGVTVAAIDPASHEITFNGEVLGYDKLLLATGASARRLDVPGADLDGVRYLRTLPEADALRTVLTADARVVIIGASWIGLEVAAAARSAGAAVTVVTSQPTALSSVLGPELGARFADLHRSHGVEFRFGDSVVELYGGHPAGVRHVGSAMTKSGELILADVVVVGIGAVPNTELAEAAGLEVDGGVVTDSALRTSAPDIFAAGDVASSFHPLLGRHLRLDHWANAAGGGQAAATSMLGQDVSYDRVPYFFSDQYDLGMECSGLPLPDGYDQVVYRGDPGQLEFIACWLKQGKLTAAMNVNVWDVTDDLQSIIRSGKTMDPTRLSNPNIPLSDL